MRWRSWTNTIDTGPHHHHHLEHEHSRRPCVLRTPLVLLQRPAMSMAGGVGATSPRRRRERQPRSFLRHEELSLKMALARALHRSVQRVEGPREGVEHEKNVGQRAQKPPLPGKRPGVPTEPEAHAGQSRSVTWLPQGLSSPHRCWRTLQLTLRTPAR